ncbi:MAG: DUF6713 family protein [Brevirhabdus sp.]
MGKAMEHSFQLMVAFFVLHELDAVRAREWRLLPVLRSMPDALGERIFLWAHLPISLGIFSILGRGEQSLAAMLLSSFAVVHVVLHWVFRTNSENRFTSVTSWTFILGAGLFGAVHLAIWGFS